MNILYLTTHLNIGGITSYLFSLAIGMKRRGHNVMVASSGGRMLSRFIEEDIGCFSIPIMTKSEISPKILISLFKLRSCIKPNSIDIIHSNTRVTQVLGWLFSCLTKAAYVSTCHGFFKNRFSRRVFPCWGLKVIAISKEVRNHLMSDFKISESNIRLIPSGIDVSRFIVDRARQLNYSLRERFSLGQGEVIGIVARLSDVKGHKYLIEAMKLVLQKVPKAHLLIVGEGRMKQDLINLVKQLNIEENVSFVPTVLDTPEVLSVMDIFVMPSLKEGLGLSLMEAMACGLAVVGSDVGGIRELIQHGYNGLLLEPYDTERLA
ncbi:MAG: glycosyltransferase family 4 protein, partial [Candidatus Omnitrophica bacterium]|nr:glycosyltransferase family 4 protein [Candidatus Omnitrophota bacterium]